MTWGDLMLMTCNILYAITYKNWHCELYHGEPPKFELIKTMKTH